MKDELDGVREHYRASGLTERLKKVLLAPWREHYWGSGWGTMLKKKP